MSACVLVRIYRSIRYVSTKETYTFIKETYISTTETLTSKKGIYRCIQYGCMCSCEDIQIYTLRLKELMMYIYPMIYISLLNLYVGALPVKKLKIYIDTHIDIDVHHGFVRVLL